MKRKARKSIKEGVVDLNRIKSVLKEYGFKYEELTKSFTVSSPFIPQDFSDYAVSIQIEPVGTSRLCRIGGIEYYKRGSGYRQTEHVNSELESYVSGILRKAIEEGANRCAMSAE